MNKSFEYNGFIFKLYRELERYERPFSSKVERTGKFHPFTKKEEWNSFEFDAVCKEHGIDMSREYLYLVDGIVVFPHGYYLREYKK